MRERLRLLESGLWRGFGVGIGCLVILGTALLAQAFTTLQSGDPISSSTMNDNFTNTRDRMPPVGAIVAWHKDFTASPPELPAGWVECDGTAVNDDESIYDGMTLPNLNGSQILLRGAGTSGGSVGMGSHQHAFSISDATDDRGLHKHGVPSVAHNPFQSAETAETGLHSHIFATSGTTALSGDLFTAFEVVYIMRIK